MAPTSTISAVSTVATAINLTASSYGTRFLCFVLLSGTRVFEMFVESVAFLAVGTAAEKAPTSFTVGAVSRMLRLSRGRR